MDIRVATYASTQISANPSPLRSNASNGTQAARAAFQSLLTTGAQTAGPAAQATGNTVQQPQPLASNPEGRGNIIDILV